MKWKAKKLKKLIVPVAAALSGTVLVTAMPYSAYAEETATTVESDADTQQPSDTAASGYVSDNDSKDTADQDGTSADETAAKDDSAATDENDKDAGNTPEDTSGEEAPDSTTSDEAPATGTKDAEEAGAGEDTDRKDETPQDNVKAALLSSNSPIPYNLPDGNVKYAYNWEYLTKDNLNIITDAGEDDKLFLYAKESLTFNDRVRVNGNVDIILHDSTTLNFKKGITVENGSSLTIWVRDKGTGKVTATSDSGNLAAISVNEGSLLQMLGGTIEAKTKTNDAAGIGGDKGKNAGVIVIAAGMVTATSDMNAAGIGGGKGGSGGDITIAGGTVTATSKDQDGAGIGGGEGGSGGKITITGGTVTAKGSSSGAGIGGGCDGGSGTITIEGGTVKATGGGHGAGIGGGRNGEGETITITGGTIDTKGGDYAAGIGGGGDSGADKILISGGKVNAWGGSESAGIGSANKGHVNTIEITGGRVYAFGKKNAAGIGGGDGNEKNGTYGTITISGEGTKVGAYGGAQAAGIGTGNDAKVNNGTINITDGAWVQAVGGSKSELFIDENDNVKRNWEEPGTHKYKEPYEEFYDGCESGAGIGGGDLTPGGTINISGKNTYVEAYGADDAAGIGSGDKAGSIGDITITDAKVFARGGGMRDTYDNFPEGIRGSGGAGIGGGRQSGSGGNITIIGAEVNARGAEYAAGIGGGDEGGFDNIIIANGANVTARGGKHGAGIGTGDVTDNGKKADWKTGKIEISGADTKVTAYGGDDGAAGIGGGEDGYGCKIVIGNVGMSQGATGFVKAIGNENCAGIGGGSERAFQSITIENAVVSAASCYGAGIGTGGGKPGNKSDSPEKGGDITIYNSAVVAVSTRGGAGIGGGIFSRADSIKIYGGVVIANGGAELDKDGMPPFAALTMEELMNRTNFEEDLLYTGNVFGEADTMEGILGNALSKETYDAGAYLLDNSNTGLYYSGAGIGGGYKAAGGEISIYDDPCIVAASGVLPKNLAKKIKDADKKNSAAIGRGRDYSGSDKSSVNVYGDPVALTGKLELNKSWYGNDLNAAWKNLQHYDVVKSDVQAGPASDPEVMSRLDNTDYQLAVIQPGIAVNFDNNGGSGVYDQVVQPGEKVNKPSDPVWEGHSFRGWRQLMEDGSTGFELFDFDQPITEQTVIQAQWNIPGAAHKVNMEDTYRDYFVEVWPAEAKAGETVRISTKNGKVRDLIVLDDMGNKVDIEFRYEYHRPLPNGVYIHDRFIFTMPDSDVYVYPVMEGTVKEYKINFGESVPYGYIVSNMDTAPAGTQVKILINDSVVVPGFHWNEFIVTDKDLNKVEVIKKWSDTYLFIMPDSDVTIDVDVYGSEAIVTFDSDGGSAVDEISISTGEKAEKPDDPVKEGYIFEGWYLVTGDSMADEPYDFNTPVYGDITLKARWRKTEDQRPADKSNSTPTGIPSANRSGAAASANVTNVKGGSTAVTKATSVKTGDTSQMPAFIAMAAAGAAGIVGAFVARKRKKTDKKRLRL